MSPAPDQTVPDKPKEDGTAMRVLVAGAIVVAALYFGRELVVPLVLASLLAFVLAPACRLLERVRIPHVAAVIIVVLIAFAIIGGLGTVVGHQAAQLIGSLPDYQNTVLQKYHALGEGDGPVARLVRSATSSIGDAKPAAGDAGGVKLPFGLDGSAGLGLLRTMAQPLLGQLETGGIVLIFTIFILMSSEDLRDRLVRLVGRQDLHRTILAMNDAARRLSQYFMFQLALNAGFGVMIGLFLWWAGLPNPLLWGIIAGLMRFVPYVGVFIALAPPLLLATAVVPGWTLALEVLALFIGAETLMGQVVEPLIYGHRTGLTPLAVIVATAFWALLWGPIGLLIATPLTVCVVVVGRHVEALSFLDVLLGDKPPLEPYETFYQRALEGRATELAPAAQQQIAATSPTEYYDGVAVPGLALAQHDLARDALAFERLEAIHGEIEALLDRLDAEPPPKLQDGMALDAAWKAPGAILCIPARGQLDDLAAAMAVRSLEWAGFGARLEPTATLGASSQADLSGTRLCCLSALEDGNTVSGIRYFIRRMQKRVPDAVFVVGLWHADRDSALLQALRSEADGGGEHLVISIGELVAFARSLAARGTRRDPAPARSVEVQPG